MTTSFTDSTSVPEAHSGFQRSSLRFNPSLARNRWSLLFTGLAAAFAAICVLPLVLVLVYVLIKGGSLISLRLLTELPPAPGLDGGGIGNAIVGTFVVSLIAASKGIEATRLEQLEALAEDLMENSSSTASVLTQLGLTDDEVALAIEGWRNNILEGDAGWSHVAKLRKVARNGWSVLFKVTYDDCDREIAVTVCAPNAGSEDAVDD
jgi:hypothetical protein